MKTIPVLKLLTFIGCIFFTGMLCEAATVSIPDTVLNSEFAYKYGNAEIVSRTDIPGVGVEFVFSGIDNSGSAFTDDYPIDPSLGGKDTHGNGDLRSFADYTMYFYNKNPYDLDISLIMNTGFTGPSAVPSNDLRNDTFWSSDWITLNPYTAQSINLDFNNAIAYNGEDNPLPHGSYPDDGGYYTIQRVWDLQEVSNIGFQIKKLGELSGSNSSLVVGSSPIPVPTTIVLLGSGLIGLAGFRRRFKK